MNRGILVGNRGIGEGTQALRYGIQALSYGIHALTVSVAEPEPPLSGWSRSRFVCWPEPPFKAALAASFWQAKKKSLVVVTKHDLKAIYNGKCYPKKTCINNSLFKSSKLKILVHGAGAAAAWSRLFFARSRSHPKLVRLRDLGLPEPPKKVAAPQHW